MKLSKKQKKLFRRICVSAVLFAVLLIVSHLVSLPWWLELILFLIPYGIVGWDILRKAVLGIASGQLLDENFLMAVASVGAFATGSCEEGVAVMLFYQIGELFQSCAVERSRRSIRDLMDICPEYANVEQDCELRQVPPDEVPVGTEIVVKPGEKIPLDGVVTDGTSNLNTAALTGESAPRSVAPGDPVASGCINLKGTLRVRTTRPYDESTVAKIVELVESSSERKARAEKFITRFARVYTPAVVIGALLIAIVPPLILGGWSEWIHRALIFLVVSCPCALVISVPLSFFGGIGGASRAGILVKGGNWLESLAKADTFVFDKTGTLTEGAFRVSAIHPHEDAVTPGQLLETAAHAELYSDHPIACSIREAYADSGQTPDASRVRDAEEIAGRGVRAVVDGRRVCAGNGRMMAEQSTECPACSRCREGGTTVHVSGEGEYLGHIVISDQPKPNARAALTALRDAGVRRIVMLTGDGETVAKAVAADVGVTEYRAGLLPADKVKIVEDLISERSGTLVFVGDGINDAPVLMRADVGVAMGGIGSDAAIEAADVVLIDDNLEKLPLAVRIARKTMRIVYENIVFALGVKFLILLLGALGVAGMWAAVFADVGVCILAVLNASRALRAPK